MSTKRDKQPAARKAKAPQPPKRTLPWGYGRTPKLRGNSWETRWMEDQPDGSRKEKSKSFAFAEGGKEIAYDAAIDHLMEIGRQKRDGRYVNADDRTIKELVEAWLRRKKQGLEPSSFATYRGNAKNQIYPELGDLPARSVSTPRLQEWIDDLQHSRGLAPSTIHLAHLILNAAYCDAVSIRILSDNPAKGLKLPVITEEPLDTWDFAEIRLVLAQVADEAMWNALYRLALTTAPRPGEIRAVQWPDLDLELEIWFLDRTMTRDENYRPIIGEHTKTKHPRAEPLTRDTVLALKVWKAEQQLLREAAGDKWMDLNLVFTRPNGNFIAQQTWAKKHRRIIEAAGVRYIPPHGMRHTNATLEMMSGTHPKVIQARLGHKSSKTTMRYTHVSVDLHRDATQAFDDRISNNTAPSQPQPVTPRKRPIPHQKRVRRPNSAQQIRAQSETPSV